MTFLEFLDQFRKAGLEWFDRYYSIYPAVVEDTNDPEKRGRIRVSLPSILGEGQILAQWVLPVGAQIGGDQTGGFFPPYEGEIIDVMFEHGDINFPRYIGGFWAKDELPEDFSVGYGANGPTVRGWVFKSGQKIIVDETEGKLKISIFNGSSYLVIDDTEGKEGFFIQHASDAIFQIQTDGSILAASPNGGTFFIDEKNKNILISSQDGSYLKLDKGISLSESTGKQIFNITDKAIEFTTGSDLVLTAANVTLKAGNVILGDTTFSACIAENIASYLDSLTVGTVMGPSTPPIISTSIFNASPATSFVSKHVKMLPNIP